MDFLQITSILIVLAAAFGAINYLFFKLPSAIGILVVSLLASLGIVVIDALLPDMGIEDTVRTTVTEVDFSQALLEGMLGFLLFAGALHVKLSDLQKQWSLILLMATLGVALSTLVFGVGAHLIFGLPLLVALVFGSLISPTDPVAVLGVLRAANLKKSLETKIAGESLFNDGVGGAVIGLFLGWLVFRVMRQIDDYPLEVLLTLALAFGVYQLSVWLRVSAPIMGVCAGLLIGDIGAKHGMSAETRDYVDAFWKLIDEILNAVLFLMIGFEVFAVTFDFDVLITGVLSIGLALLARFAAVFIPVLLLQRRQEFSNGIVPIMTCGGLKGGISVALALSLPDSEWKPMILAATYVVVIFLIIVQGLTIAPLAKHLGREPDLL